MTQDFDILISKAAPEVPDSGESRRAAHALLREKMRREDRRVRNRDRRWVSMAAVVVFLTVITGQVSQLGSDGFDFELGVLEIGNGESVPVIINKNRGRIGNALPSMTTDDIYELQQVILLREGTIKYISAYSLNNGTPFWSMEYEKLVNDQMVTMPRPPTNLSVKNGSPNRELLPFFIAESENFEAMIDTGELSPLTYGTISADGFTFKVQKWTKEYSEWGTITYFRGLPIQKNH